MNTIKNVAVVGGGLAGLAAAHALLRSGNLDVDVFESQPCLGGRIQSREVRGRQVDFGGFLVYPWYEESHRLFQELGVEGRLEKTPLSDIYYVLERDAVPVREDDIPFSKRDGLRIWSKSIFKILPKPDVSAPDLERFDGKTISEYLRSTLDTDGHAGLYETFFDTVNQGYCYGPVDQAKAAFMAPIVRQVKFHGDIRSTSFFPRGGKDLIDRIAQEIRSMGGQIHLNAEITGIDGLALQTGRHAYAHDAVVFAQTVSADLYRQILPGTEPGCRYTHFITAAVDFNTIPVVAGTRDWGAVFYAPDGSADRQVLSAINLSSLYGKELEGCVMVNMVVREQANQPFKPAAMAAVVGREIRRIFPDGGNGSVVESVHWAKAMPVAQEAFVAAVRAGQGVDGRYFAGDFLGAPSMEVAIATGRAAARMILDAAV